MIQFATVREEQEATSAVLSDERVWHEIRRVADSLLMHAEPLPARSGASVRELSTGRGRFVAHAVPLRGPGAQPPGVLLVAIERTEPQLPTLFELQRSFELTPREAEVAILLAKRRSNREIADELDVTPYTARRHTEKVLLKLRVRRRTDVRRVLLEYGVTTEN